MGFFDKFKKKAAAPAPKPQAVHIEEQADKVYAPANGTGVAMADLPDPVFAGGAMGQAYGVNPSEGVVYAPVSGEITVTTPTLHALGLLSDDGIEILIHVGVDTVEMKGDGFTGFVEKGQHVVAGEPLMTFDRDKIAKAGHPDVVITVVTNGDDYTSVTPIDAKPISAGEPIITVAK